jgi:NADH:ubiquinone oxidoreductase subunit 4 (subunit M)
MACISILYASLTTIRQTDLKRIIAYSSIAHMNLAVLGIFSYTHQGIDGAIYLMISHGITSGALFACIGVLYDRYHTRLLFYFSGLTQVMPCFSIIFLIFSLANAGFPGTANFIGEFLIFVGLFEKNTTVTFIAATGIVFSAVYSI